MDKLKRNIVKDFRVEFRNRTGIILPLSFSFAVTLAVSLASGGVIPARMQSVFLWIILFFAAMNGLSHTFVREEEQGTSVLLNFFYTPSLVFSAKLVFNLFMFFVLEAVTVPLFVFFVQADIKSVSAFFLILTCGGFAVSASVTALAAIVARAGGKSSLFTIISLPVILPVLWICIESTHRCMLSPDFLPVGNAVFLLAFSGLLIALSYLLTDVIWATE